MKPTANAEIFITKLVAAKRQLRAAIRLFFAREDELAIHSIVSAAHNLLRELKKTRGKDEAEDQAKLLLVGLVSLAKARQEGKLPEWAAGDAYLDEWLKTLPERIPLTENMDLSSISVTMGASARKTFCDNRVANFLKHADRDVDGAISTRDVKNLQLLVLAANSYDSVAPDDLELEGLVLAIYLLASLDTELEDTHPLCKSVRDLRGMPADERIDFCNYQLRRPRPANVD